MTSLEANPIIRSYLPSELVVCEEHLVTLCLPETIWPTPCIQWQVNNGSTWTNVRKGTQPCFKFIANRKQDGYKYRALVQSKCECWVTNSVKLSVNYIDITQPTSQQSFIGGTVAFTSSATGKPPVTSMWWEVSTNGGQTWSLIPNETSTSLTLTNVQANQCSNLYRAVFDNGCIERSNPAKLIIYRTLAYVTNSGSNNVTVIDTATNTVITTIPVGTNTRGIAITPNGRYAYVANYNNNNVSVIDTATNTVITTVPVGNNPWAIAITPNGNYTYVANSGSNNVSVIDTSTNMVIGSPIPVGTGPFGIAITPDGNFAYVTNRFDNNANVSVIDTSTNMIIGSPIPVGNGPFGIAITPDGNFAYAANSGSNDVSVIDISTNTVIATVPVGNGSYEIAITPDSNFAYVANFNNANVSVIDTSTNMVIGSPIPVGNGPFGIAITPDGNFAYVTNIGSDNVSVIDTSTNTAIGSPIPVGNNPSEIAIGNIPLC